MYKYIIALIASAVLPTTSYGIALAVTNFSEASPSQAKPVSLSNGTLIPSTQGVVGYGFFNTMDGSTITSASALKASLGDFILFGSTGRFGGGFDSPGLASRSNNINLTAGASRNWTSASGTTGINLATNNLVGKNIYVIIGNGSATTGSSGTGNLSASSEYLLVQSSYSLRIDPTGSEEFTIQFQNAGNNLLVGSAGPSITYAGGDAVFNGQSMSTFALEAVPEPTTLAGLALGLGTLVRRRRK